MQHCVGSFQIVISTPVGAYFLIFLLHVNMAAVSVPTYESF